MLWLLAALLIQCPDGSCSPWLVQAETPPTAKPAPLEDIIDWTVEPEIRTVRRNPWYFYR